MKHFYTILFCFFSSLLIAQPGSESAITSINASIPYQGYGEGIAHLGTGEYKIYYDNVDGVLDKPIFFVDGFDPNDSRTIPLMYDLLNFGNPVQNLADLVRDEGYDLIVLNFPTYTSVSDGSTVIDGGGDFIQRNAFILSELIDTINGLKVGAEENVVIGPSMGGLISRYALSYMEQNTINHDTRLYVSFDSPHLGANVLIGIQYTFNYLVNGLGATDLEPLVDGLLNSAAAKQMLIDHYLGHVDGSGLEQDGSIHTPKGAPNYRDAFQTELDALGFSSNTRNIAVTNGSGQGQLTGTPGMELINNAFNIDGFDVSIDIHFTPQVSQNITVSDIDISFFGFPVSSFSATAESTADSDGLDSAPGGQFDLYSFDDGSNALVTEFVNSLNSQYFNFIPTLSGLAISSETNWYALPDENDSPFDDVYIPTNNEPHVTLTQGNVDFVLNEIYSGALSVEDFDIAEIRLKQNPVHNSITLLNTTNFSEANISVYDMMGKPVQKVYTQLESETILPINLASGIYILNIEAEGNFYNYKLVVR